MTSYSHLEVRTAANLDADTVTIIDFMVNATVTMLENQDAGIEDVIREHWGDAQDEDSDAIRKLFTNG